MPEPWSSSALSLKDGFHFRNVTQPGRHLDLSERISERISEPTGASQTEVVRRSLDLWFTEETLDLLYRKTR